MSEDEIATGDPELEARLTAAFAQTRPRPGFEGELWGRIGSPPARGLRLRLRWPRLNGPAWAGAGAVAGVLVTLLAVAPLLVGNHSKPVSQAAGRAAAPAAGSASTGSTGVQAFGSLPRPALASAGAVSPAPTTGLPAVAGSHMALALNLPTLPATLPVWRFAVPAAAELTSMAAALGGVPAAPAAGYREPLVTLTGALPGGAGAGSAIEAADRFLQSRGASPAWPNREVVLAGGTVVYVRQFPVAGLLADQIDESGLPAGAEVGPDAAGGGMRATVPLADPAAAPVQYVTRTLAQITQDALNAGVGPYLPAVALNEVRLVYIAVDGGTGSGYFEPALLFTGALLAGSARYERRVLVPALAATAP